MCVYVVVVVGGADGGVPLIMLADVCQHCRLLKFVLFIFTAFQRNFYLVVKLGKQRTRMGITLAVTSIPHGSYTQPL